MQAEVTAIEHTDVRGNKLLYMKIKTDKNELLINIGKKTFEAIQAMEPKVKQPIK